MINFEKRLQALKERRQGTRERNLYKSVDSFSEGRIVGDSHFDRKESYEKLNESAGVKYAIGAMAPVDQKSTGVSISEGERVANNLINCLFRQGIYVESKLQGSVALDIHIKGHSDVDMLIIVQNPVSVELPKVNPSFYSPSSDHRSLVNIVRDLRLKSELILTINFPNANVDCTGNKSIALEGDSLARKVDIVPACWYDSRAYQISRKDSDRGVKIYHKSDHLLCMNYPFKHIELINGRDFLYQGNLKRVIRLMKNMVADMPDYKKKVVKRLSSYDLAAIAYYMEGNLSVPIYMQLSLVEKTREHLNHLMDSWKYRNMLYVPDGSRKIFDRDDKVQALEILAKECSDLAESISQQIEPHYYYDPSILQNKPVFETRYTNFY